MKTEYFKIKEYPFNQYIGKIILLCWIVFAIIKFNINPNFFGATIIVAVFLILSITETSIEAKERFLEIKYRNWSPFLNKSEKIDYKDIVNIEYIKPEISGVSILLNLIVRVHGTLRKGPKLYLTLSENKWKEIDAFGKKSQIDKLIKVVKSNVRTLKPIT